MFPTGRALLGTCPEKPQFLLGGLITPSGDQLSGPVCIMPAVSAQPSRLGQLSFVFG